MSDEPSTAPSASPPPPTPTPRGLGLGWLIGLVLMIVALGAWGWSQWRDQAQRSAQRDSADAQLQQRIETLETALESARRNLKALETRAADNAATNTVLREELLGMGERASLLEDAVARLADNRLRGEVMLRLNEAEFLLLLGEERLRLFGDVPAAIQAYGLAEGALASLDDPVLATLRQTLAQEVAALRAVPADARGTIRSGLTTLGLGLEALPASRQGQVGAAQNNDSRLVRLLSGLVTVRRIDAQDAVLGPAQREAAIAALRLQLELAQAALARPDPAAYAHALDQVGLLYARLFDADDATVANRLASLKTLREAVLVPELPVLGATLQELRGMRATRSVGAVERAVPDPAPVAAEAATPEGGE